jgi:hypothetical protein
MTSDKEKYDLLNSFIDDAINNLINASVECQLTNSEKEECILNIANSITKRNKLQLKMELEKDGKAEKKEKNN